MMLRKQSTLQFSLACLALSYWTYSSKPCSFSSLSQIFSSSLILLSKYSKDSVKSKEEDSVKVSFHFPTLCAARCLIVYNILMSDMKWKNCECLGEGTCTQNFYNPGPPPYISSLFKQELKNSRSITLTIDFGTRFLCFVNDVS